jgi:hypothetical protein
VRSGAKRKKEKIQITHSHIELCLMCYVKLVKEHMCFILGRYMCESLLENCESNLVGVNNPNSVTYLKWTTMFERCVWLGVDLITSM